MRSYFNKTALLVASIGAVSLVCLTSLNAHSNSPPEVQISRHIETSRKAPYMSIGYHDGIEVKLSDPKTLTATGIEAVTTDGFNPKDKQTSEERYFRIVTFPPGYSAVKIEIRNVVDPTDVIHVEQTPRYWLFLDEHRLRGHIWLRPGGFNSHSTDLTLDLTVRLKRDDLYDNAVNAHEFTRLPQDTLVYYRTVDKCNQLRIEYKDIMQVDRSVTDATHSTIGIAKACSKK